MIRLNKIVKRYNLHKANEFTVLKDITLDFAETGLVVLVGTSGSGKTTLLNIISGLHSFDSGSIKINDQEFKHFHDRKFSKLRQDTFGFIFQNYQLLENETVSQNIKLALQFSDCLEKDLDDLVRNSLKSVGLEEYHNRKAMFLSGGEQQRVAIARALCKQPNILLADEPTGNLDSMNSIQIMDLLKSISKSKLVIMVTHDDVLASVYADRIIRIANGTVESDIIPINQSKDVLRSFELNKDTQAKDELLGKHSKMIYYGEPVNDLEIIQHNNTLYLNTEKPVRNILKQEKMDYPMMEERVLEKVKHPFLNKVKLAFRLAFKQLTTYSLRSKLFLIALAVVGMVLAVTLGLYGKATKFEDNDLVTKYRDYVTVELKDTSVKTVKEIDFGPNAMQLQYIMDEIKLYVKTPVYYEVDNVISVKAHPTLASVLTEEDLLLGRLPENKREVILDRSIANELLRISGERGIDQLADLLHASIVLNASGSLSDQNEDSLLYFPIVGIATDDTPTVFMSEELMYAAAMGNVLTEDLLPYEIEMIGRMPATYREVLVNDHYVGDSDFIPRSVGTTIGTMEVTGYYQIASDTGTHNYRHILITTLDYMKDVYFTVYNVESYGSELLVLSSDVDATINHLRAQNKTAYSQYLLDVEAETRLVSEETMSVTIYTTVAFLAAAISIYFISRASLLHRMKSIAILRALGATKFTVELLFLVELFTIASLSSVLFFSFTTIGLLQVQRNINEIFTIFDFPALMTFSAVLFLYFVQIIFGLLPVLVVLQSTPADLFTKYDIS